MTSSSRILAVSVFLALVSSFGCGGSAGDGEGGEAGCASGGSGGAGTGGDATGGVGSGGRAQGGAGQGGQGQGGQLQGSGGEGGGTPAMRCADAVHCAGIQGYFCHEISGPSAAFEANCTNDLGGQFGQGPCGAEYADGGCLFDCVEPSIYAIAISIDQTQCEMDGGTYVAHP